MGDLITAWTTAKTGLQSLYDSASSKKTELVGASTRAKTNMANIKAELDSYVAEFNNVLSTTKRIALGWKEGSESINLFSRGVITGEWHNKGNYFKPVPITAKDISRPDYLRSIYQSISKFNGDYYKERGMTWSDRGNDYWRNFTHTTYKGQELYQFFVDRNNLINNVLIPLADKYVQKLAEFNKEKSAYDSYQPQITIYEDNLNILSKVKDEINKELQKAYLIESDFQKEQARKQNYTIALQERQNELTAITNSLVAFQLELQGVEKSIIEAREETARQKERGYTSDLRNSIQPDPLRLYNPPLIEPEIPDIGKRFDEYKNKKAQGLNLLYFTPLILLL